MGTLVRFALTLPRWQKGQAPPRPFVGMREATSTTDLRHMQFVGLGPKYMQTIGFKNFVAYMEKRIERMFVDSLGPVLKNLKQLKETAMNCFKCARTDRTSPAMQEALNSS